MGEIFKVPQKAGQRGRPPHVKVVGAKRQETEPEIKGAAVPGEPTIIDGTTKQETQTSVEIRNFVKKVEEDDRLRQQRRKPGDPEVRVILTDPEWSKRDAD